MSEQTDGLEQLLNLEEKIQQTIELLRTTRAEKEALERENVELRVCSARRCGRACSGWWSRWTP